MHPAPASLICTVLLLCFLLCAYCPSLDAANTCPSVRYKSKFSTDKDLPGELGEGDLGAIPDSTIIDICDLYVLNYAFGCSPTDSNYDDSFNLVNPGNSCQRIDEEDVFEFVCCYGGF